jgi:KDO2-lipid IV(A) lauroyltransferase
MHDSSRPGTSGIGYVATFRAYSDPGVQMRKPGRLNPKKTTQSWGSPSDQPRRTRADVRVLLDAAPEVVFEQCRSPRYWPIWLFAFWLRLTAALPWSTALKIHKLLGRVAGALSPRSWRVVRRNLELCFPELGSAEIRRIMAENSANVGAFFAELAFAWYGSPEQRARLFRFEGLEHLHAALAKGKGVLLYSGHFTPIEICGATLKSQVPLYAFMFKARRNPLMNALQKRGRGGYAHVSVTNDDVREMLALLARNAVVWYSPDQARVDSGELVPFFSQPAMTSTAPSRLARLSGAAIVPLFFRRLPDDSGYLLRFHAPLADLPSRDAIADTARLTAMLESFIRECPEHYFWTHRKFKDRPGSPDAYS